MLCYFFVLLSLSFLFSYNNNKRKGNNNVKKIKLINKQNNKSTGITM